jgi:hypothetical protein
MLINSDIRNILPHKASDFDELEKQYAQLKSRFYSRIKTPKPRQVNINCTHFLLSALSRGISSLDGLEIALNNNNVLSAFLIVRAHYESTGALAFFLRELKKYTNGNYTNPEFISIVRKMTFGMKKLPEKDNPQRSKVPIINNVLNYIDEADEFSRKNFDLKQETPFRDNYDFLSEFCHPNAFGLMLGSSLEEKFIKYEQSPSLNKKHLTALLSHILYSSLLFLIIFDETWRNISEKIGLPELQK